MEISLCEVLLSQFRIFSCLATDFVSAVCTARKAGQTLPAGAPCMTLAPETVCLICQKGRARNGKGANKYCDAHIPEGIAAGHIKSKRQRVQSEAASSSVTSMPDDWKLLAIERILDSRCATTPPLLPPVPNTHALSARGPRCCKLDGKDAVDKENGLVTEEEMRENVEYLVLGHFERKET